jgi:hypothetical protein
MHLKIRCDGNLKNFAKFFGTKQGPDKNKAGPNGSAVQHFSPSHHATPPSSAEEK